MNTATDPSMLPLLASTGPIASTTSVSSPRRQEAGEGRDEPKPGSSTPGRTGYATLRRCGHRRRRRAFARPDCLCPSRARHSRHLPGQSRDAREVPRGVPSSQRRTIPRTPRSRSSSFSGIPRRSHRFDRAEPRHARLAARRRGSPRPGRGPRPHHEPAHERAQAYFPRSWIGSATRRRPSSPTFLTAGPRWKLAQRARDKTLLDFFHAHNVRYPRKRSIGASLAFAPNNP